MSDHDRGPYSPRSDRLAFDPREPVRSGPAPVALLFSAILLIALIAGVVFLYRGGFRHKDGPPATVGAPVAQIKTAPPPETNTASVLTIDKSESTNTMPHFAPAPEEPMLRPAVAPPAVVPAPPTAPAVTPAKAIATNAVQAPAAPAKSDAIGSLADAAAANHAAAQRAAALLAPKAPGRPAEAATPAPTAATPAPGTAWAQIGAFSSSALADKGWSDIAHFQPGAMKGKGKKVETTERDGKTFYRAFVTGFASHDAAAAFCAKLSAASKPCIAR